MTDLQRLAQLTRGEHPCVLLQTCEEEEALDLVRNVALEFGRDLTVWSMSKGVHDGMVANTAYVTDTEHPAAALYHLATRDAGSMIAILDLAGHLKDLRTLRQLRELIRGCRKNQSQLFLIDPPTDLPAAIRAVATPFELTLPDEKQLEALVRETLRARNEQRRIQVDLTRAGLDTILRNLRGLTLRQARQVIVDTVCEDQRLDPSDLATVLARKRQHLEATGLLEYVESPVNIDQVGGLDRLKGWLKRRENAMTPEAMEFGIEAPRGVLMLGVQGAGKSLAAKAVATAWQRPLLRMDVGALYDKFIGESERRLRDAFRQAEMMAPIVLWIDEIEKGFASAASQSSDGGLSKRMFGELLTWMQEHRAPVFLIATANDIDALPPELLRKGRFDEIFFIDLPMAGARQAIFEIHLRKRKRDPAKFDLKALVAASEEFSGAEIEQAIIAGLHDAFAARVELTTAHVLESLKQSPPLSVTMAEKIADLRQWAKGRCSPAD